MLCVCGVFIFSNNCPATAIYWFRKACWTFPFIVHLRILCLYFDYNKKSRLSSAMFLSQAIKIKWVFIILPMQATRTHARTHIPMYGSIISVFLLVRLNLQLPESLFHKVKFLCFGLDWALLLTIMSGLKLKRPAKHAIMCHGWLANKQRWTIYEFGVLMAVPTSNQRKFIRFMWCNNIQIVSVAEFNSK